MPRPLSNFNTRRVIDGWTNRYEDDPVRLFMYECVVRLPRTQRVEGTRRHRPQWQVQCSRCEWSTECDQQSLATSAAEAHCSEHRSNPQQLQHPDLSTDVLERGRRLVLKWLAGGVEMLPEDVAGRLISKYRTNVLVIEGIDLDARELLEAVLYWSLHCGIHESSRWRTPTH